MDLKNKFKNQNQNCLIFKLSLMSKKEKYKKISKIIKLKKNKF